MNKKYKYSIHIFTRDLRIHDNTCLNFLLKNSDYVVPIFIFTPEQITKNKYKSNNSVQFLCETLNELKKEIKIGIFYGDNITVLKKIIKKIKINAISITKDYTPFSVKRESVIEHFCLENNIEFVCMEDYMLTGVNIIKNKSNKFYTKFTPYYNTAKNYKIKKCDYESFNNFFKINDNIDMTKLYIKNNNTIQKGGRKNALKLLKNDLNKYDKTRNYLEYNTSLLSPYIKFGCISIREIYFFVKNNEFRKQLYWRDFYYTIAYHHPHVFGNNMNNKNIKWINDKKIFDSWKNGNTGFPIVDAGMRQLNTIGYMHNRARLITSNFLIKILHIDWKYGEKYFAQKLVDYDPMLNNGNWQWSGSTGVDSQPYFRYFNPWLQSKKFDLDCSYIKKWIPALKNIDSKYIHQWNIYYKNFDINFPKPIIDDIGVEIIKTKKLYAGISIS